MNKKAQVTVFIALGIIILVALGLYYISRTTLEKPRPIIVVPEEAKAVHSYTTECAKDSAEEAVFLLGLQSGYVKVPEEIRRVYNSYLRIDDVFLKPYWYYPGHLRIPSEDEIKQQIAGYVKEDMLDCVDNFEVFKNQYEIRNLSEPDVKVSFSENDVFVEVNYKLEIKNLANDVTVNIEEYAASVPVRLKIIYELAKRIMETEQENHFMENVTIDFMAMNKNIPFTGMEVSCNPSTWYVWNIKKEIQDMLYYNLPRIRIRNTEYLPFEQTERVYDAFRKVKRDDEGNLINLPKSKPPADIYEYNSLMFDVGTPPRENINVGFVYYPEYGMDLFARPSENGVLLSNIIEVEKTYLNFLCINLYHFTYDVIYPVEVIIRDEKSNGYTFSFVFDVVIESNAANRESLSIANFERVMPDEGFCIEKGESNYDIRAKGIYNGYNDMDIPFANITYICINKYCNLGITKNEGGVDRLITTLPAGCSNPVLYASKKGYLEGKKQISDEDYMVNIEMKKLKDLDIKVVKHMYGAADKTLHDAQALEEDRDSVSIFISNNEHQQYKIYPFEADAEDEDKVISVLEEGANYDVNIVFTRTDDFAGGYIGGWNITKQDLAGRKEVVFHVIDYRGTPKTDEERTKMMQYLMEGDYKEKLRPEIK